MVPSGPLRTDYVSLHIMLGVLLAVVLLIRLGWRLTRGLMLPPDRHWLLSAAARATHWALYLLLITTVALGMLNAWTGGDVIFNLFRLPTFPGSDRALHRLIAGWHALAANTVMIVAGFHAAAALGHHYVLRDDVLARMAPFLGREQPAPGE
jgi:cytochrome b561